jgi:acetylornithine/succinyldiaminopimelate/putrescine aminotransferase
MNDNSAIEHYPTVVPDILVIAKGIANGFPLSGIVSRKELMDLQPAGSMGGTYAGNAVSCAAGTSPPPLLQWSTCTDMRNRYCVCCYYARRAHSR